MHVGTFNLWSVNPNRKSAREPWLNSGRQVTLIMVQPPVKVHIETKGNGPSGRQWRGYDMNLLQLRFTHLYTLIGCSEGVPPSRNESPWRMVRRSAFYFGNWCEAWPEVTCIWWAILRNMCLRSPWALPGTPTAGTPRNGTPRNGTPRNGTPRKGGGTPRNGEARGFWFAHCCVDMKQP